MSQYWARSFGHLDSGWVFTPGPTLGAGGGGGGGGGGGTREESYRCHVHCIHVHACSQADLRVKWEASSLGS